MSLGDAVARAKAFVLTRKQAYNITFERGVYTDKVLADLARFCRADATCVVPGDDRATAVLEGRREVWLRINEHLHMTPEELYNLYK